MSQFDNMSVKEINNDVDLSASKIVTKISLDDVLMSEATLGKKERKKKVKKEIKKNLKQKAQKQREDVDDCVISDPHEVYTSGKKEKKKDLKQKHPKKDDDVDDTEESELSAWMHGDSDTIKKYLDWNEPLPKVPRQILHHGNDIKGFNREIYDYYFHAHNPDTFEGPAGSPAWEARYLSINSDKEQFETVVRDVKDAMKHGRSYVGEKNPYFNLFK